jgi:hypothetical protein
MKLTEQRAALLLALDAVQGGWLKSEQIKIGHRRMATAMQRDGLVEWKNASGSRHSLAGQVLHITDKGRNALLQHCAENF